MKRHDSFAAAANATPERGDAVCRCCGLVTAQYGPWLSLSSLTSYLDFPNEKACRRWVETTLDLPRGHRGLRTLLFERRLVDAHVRGDLRRAAVQARRRTRSGLSESRPVFSSCDAVSQGASDVR